MPRTKSLDPNCVLSPGTFGGTPASHILVSMLNANVIPPSEKHRVLNLIGSATYNFKWLSVVPEWGVKYRAMTAMRQEFNARVDQWTYPELIKSLTKNVISHHYRRYLKEAAWTIAP